MPGLHLIVDPDGQMATTIIQDEDLASEKNFYVLDPFKQVNGRAVEKRCALNLIGLLDADSESLLQKTCQAWCMVQELDLFGLVGRVAK